jgi:aminopeptidase N
LSSDTAARLAPTLAHALAHAGFRSPRAWLSEGVANFIANLWIDSTSGHAAAMDNLNAGRQALALAEPATPGQGNGQDLLHATSPVYYRTKATYVLWMLRNLIGDKALASALQAYKPDADTQPDYFERLAEKASGSDLRWFFDSWVYQDRGLPDLSIEGVFPTPEAHQQYLVATQIRNDGYAEAYIPLTLRAGEAAATNWVRVPAHGSITHRMLFQQSPTEVDLNDGSVPEVRDSTHQRILTDAPPQ